MIFYYSFFRSCKYSCGVFALIAALFYTPMARAQVNNPTFSRITVAEGLVQDNIECILQDSRGYMWIATGDGLNRYDGTNLEVYKYSHLDTNTLSSNSISSLFVDAQERLWVGTANDLNLYNRDLDQFERIGFTFNQHNDFPNTVLCMEQYHDSLLLLGTNNSIFIFDPHTKELTPILKEFYEDELIYCVDIAKDQHGGYWFAVNNSKLGGLYAYNDQTGESDRYNMESEQVQFPTEGLSRITVDRQNRLWVGTGFEGVLVLDIDAFTMSYYKNQPGNNNTLANGDIESVLQAKDGLMWIGTNGGLSIVDPQTEQVYNIRASDDENSLASNTVSWIYQAKDQSIWLGCRGKGVSVYDKRFNKFEHYKHMPTLASSLSANSVTCFAEDEKGHVWISVDNGGINYFDPQTKLFVPHLNRLGQPNIMTNNKVLAIETDLKGGLWSGMWQGGLNYFEIDNDQFKLKRKYDLLNPSDPQSGSVFCIHRAPDGQLWVGTYFAGVFKYNPSTQLFDHVPLYTASGKLVEFTMVSNIDSDHAGNVWVATQVTGLYKLDQTTGKQTVYVNDPNDPTSLPSNNVAVVREDSKHRIWVGTLADGLACLNTAKGSFTTFTQDDGLPNNTISSIQIDPHDNLWLGTNNGISRVKVLESDSGLFLKYRNYIKSDGLQNPNFNMWAELTATDGAMYFGGNNGFNKFYPDSVQDNHERPKVVFTDFMLFNKPVAIGGKNSPLSKHISETGHITLTHEQLVFSFRFVALNYINGNTNTYAYKMENFDADWNYIGQRREATYTNLAPGRYRFRVKATNNDGVWNEVGSAIELTILPPWWQTWLFRIAVVLVVSGIVVGYYRYRLNALKRRQQELERVVSMRTEELSEANVVLEERQEEILQQAEELRSQKQQLEDSFKDSQLISEFGQRLTSTLSLAVVSDMMYEHVSSIMRVDSFGIGLYNEELEAIVFPVFIQQGQKLQPSLKSVNDKSSLSIWCLVNQKTVFINDRHAELHRYIGNAVADQEIQTSRQAQSIIHLPLTVDDKRIGLLAVNSFRKNEYSEKDLVKLQMLASYIAIALDNANAYRLVDTHNKNMQGSITYAQTIQQSILPSKQAMDACFDNFVLFRPKDIVSGDFYWVKKIALPSSTENPYLFAAVIDCTGHGVPGAFMSILGTRMLDDIVEKEKNYAPDRILDRLNQQIKKSLKQDSTNNDDGMDVCLVRMQKKETGYEVLFANAKRPLYYYGHGDGKLERIRSGINTCGGHFYIENKGYPLHQLELQQGDMLWLTSDGYTDQNNIERKDFGKTQLLHLLGLVAEKPLTDQKEALEQSLDAHQQHAKQRDDITIMGIRLA